MPQIQPALQSETQIKAIENLTKICQGTRIPTYQASNFLAQSSRKEGRGLNGKILPKPNSR